MLCFPTGDWSPNAPHVINMSQQLMVFVLFFVTSCLAGSLRGQKRGRNNTLDKRCTAKSATSLCLFVSGFTRVRNLFLHKVINAIALFCALKKTFLIPLFYSSWGCNIKIQRKLGNWEEQSAYIKSITQVLHKHLIFPRRD